MFVAIAPPSLPAAGCGGAAPLELSAPGIPPDLTPLYERAASRYRLGVEGPGVLAAINRIETAFGQNIATSSAGAIGWMQFMRLTWARYGVDANGDGRKDPDAPADAIFAAANYLRASGAPANWYRAVFAYNHADWYVQQVLTWAKQYGNATASGSLADVRSDAGATSDCGAAVGPSTGEIKQICAGGRFVPIPGFPGERIDVRLLRDVAYLRAHYHAFVTDAYALTGHEPRGEHPVGLAADIVPGPGGSWDDIDRLARWAEPRQNAPRPPFRWVGYNGDANHGRGNHLHLSWSHSEPHAPGRPVRCVTVFDAFR